MSTRPGLGTTRPAMPLLTLVTGALLFGTTFFGGGSGDDSVLWVGGAAALVAAGGIAAWSLGWLVLPRLDASGTVAAAALVALTLWTGISVAWSIAGDLSWSALNKGIAFAAFFTVGAMLAVLGERTTRTAAFLLAAVLGLALAWALLGKAVPALFAGGTHAPRLRNPVGYSNALALLANAALALGLWLAVAASRRREVRAAGGLLVYLSVLATLMTSSRTGTAGAVLAFAFWARAGGRALDSAVAVVAAGAPAAAVAGWAFTRPALVDAGQTHAARVHDGTLFGVLALAGAALAVGLALEVPARVVAGREQLVARTLLAGAAAAIVVGLVAVSVAAGNPFVKAAHGFSRGECTNAPGRLGSLCTNNRLQWWREAWHVFAAQPAGGTGANTFRIARTRYRRNAEFVSEPHSVPLQVLAGTGVVGGALLALLVGGLGVGITRGIRRLDGGERAAAVALAALPVAYALHALVDYDLDYLAVTGPTLLVAGLLVGVGRPRLPARGGLLVGLAGASLAIAAIASFASPWLANRKVEAAYRAIDGLRLQQAVDDAKAARTLNPLSLEPLYARARVDLRAGDTTGAYVHYLDATRLQPENADAWYFLGLFDFERGDLCAAYQALNHAYTLDPRSSRWTPHGELDRARAAVNDRVHPACGR